MWNSGVYSAAQLASPLSVASLVPEGGEGRHSFCCDGAAGVPRRLPAVLSALRGSLSGDPGSWFLQGLPRPQLKFWVSYPEGPGTWGLPTPSPRPPHSGHHHPPSGGLRRNQRLAIIPALWEAEAVGSQA